MVFLLLKVGNWKLGNLKEVGSLVMAHFLLHNFVTIGAKRREFRFANILNDLVRELT